MKLVTVEKLGVFLANVKQWANDTFVPLTRKINGKELSEDITIDATDIDAIPLSDKGVAGGVATLNESGCVPESQLPKLISSTGELYSTTKTSFDVADGDVINEYFASLTDVTPNNGDVIVVTTLIGDVEYESSAYRYSNGEWVALAGNVDADKVILRDDILMAGDYTQVGNKTKTKTGTATFETSGMSVADALAEIFSKRLQPTITAKPSVGTFTLTNAGAVEAGTKLESVTYSAASLNAGTYTYGPATGVVATNWVVNRVTDSGSVEVVNEDSSSLISGVDDNDGNGFIIGDMGLDEDVASLKYEVIATYSDGVVANDNMGDASNPEIKISGSTTKKVTAAFTPYRNYFYGASNTTSEINSDYIRSLDASGAEYAAGELTVEVPAGSTRVCVACVSNVLGVTKIINASAMNADVTSTFTKISVDVEGANGYSATEYNVWYYEPAKAYENTATLVFTLG